MALFFRWVYNKHNTISSVYFDSTMTHVAHLLMANRTYLFLYSCQPTKDETLIRLPKHYFCISRCNNFFSLSLFNLLQPSFFLSSYFFSFLIFVFWFEKWINRDWGRAKRKNFALCFVSIITCTLRFKIDCSYQNGIRDYVYISQPHSTAPSNWILLLYFSFLLLV